ncbi:MAG: gamma-glutamyl-gamma-aminobutyrate hydrolase family protein [Bacilli bacterium]|jgi:CTP synthase (UTP-ammonia lyase)
MNLIIGVLGRPKKANQDITIISKSLTDVIVKYNNIPLGIVAPVIDVNNEMNEGDIAKLHKVLSLCSGIILQGGLAYYQYDLEAIKYIYENNIPLLGICLGMQSIGVAFGAALDIVDNHKYVGIPYVHDVVIDKHSKLYQIVETNHIRVNSRHNEMIIKPQNIKVVGYSDGVIEAIEKENRPFFLGVQWHPEDMIEYDEASRKIFEHFFLACEKHSKQ